MLNPALKINIKKTIGECRILHIEKKAFTLGSQYANIYSHCIRPVIGILQTMRLPEYDEPPLY
jgi:hypothetical protein